MSVSDNDSLFDDDGGDSDEFDLFPRAAQKSAPTDIPGLHFPDVKISEALARDLLTDIMPYFLGGAVNQVMLFGNSSPDSQADPSTTAESFLASMPHGLPAFIYRLLSELSPMLHHRVPISTHDLLFPKCGVEKPHPYSARQVILNLYRPGEGITPHVDLLRRFGDGIMLVSLVSGTVMEFTPVPERAEDVAACEERKQMLWLTPRSVLVLEGEARYSWTHGIPARMEDFVEGREGEDSSWVDRRFRVSITIRWLLPGADVVGGPSSSIR